MVATAARVPVKRTHEAVDLVELKASVTDPASQFYFPRLMQRFE